MESVALPVYSVSGLTAEIKELLETGFSEVWVEGEVSNLRFPLSGHIYFTLKDQLSQIQAVIFKTRARGLVFQLEDGLRVICRARVSVYEKKGQYQIFVDFIEPRGMGAYQLAFDQLKRRLEAEGLFDPSRKKPLPFLIRRIGIVTSPTGAVIRDMLNVLNRRYPNLQVLLYPVRVQGEGAGEEIAGAIAFMDAQADVDVIVLARGGGSFEDLLAFNEERVVRAIGSASKPVVSAVGHEVDFTLSDFAADLRAPTPSAAAELVVKNKADLVIRIAALSERLVKGLERILMRKREHWARVNLRLRDPRRRVDDLRLKTDDLLGRLAGSIGRISEKKRAAFINLEKNLIYRNPLARLGVFRFRCGQRKEQLERLMHDRLASTRQVLERIMDRLESLSPLNILRRGYSIARRIPSMEILRDSTTMKRGDRVDLRLHRGGLICGVDEIKE